jgi:hypothetical protein
MVKVYTTLLDAEKDLIQAESQLSHGGKQLVAIEHHALGYVIAEFKLIKDSYVFQRYYKGE